MNKFWFLALGLCLLAEIVRAEDSIEENVGTVEKDHGESREASRTDAEAVQREEEQIKLDGLNVAQWKELKAKAEKSNFQTDVSRMMNLIINSLYANKEIFLRELISNAADALDKIRLLSLTNSNILDKNPEMSIRLKVDKENKLLSLTDTGIGMTKEELSTNLGTIAKSGTAEFLSKMQKAAVEGQDTNDMIGQFGVGFYSAFLVSHTITVASKHNDDKQHIWESDSSSFTVVEDPRGDVLKRGTTIHLHMKDEALDFLEEDRIRSLIKKYSQFIDFPIYLWSSKTIQVDAEEEKDEEAEKKKDESKEDETVEEEDGKVEDSSDDEKKPKKVDKTIWDWELLNDAKPIWTMKPNEISDEQYNSFYKSLTKDTQKPLAKTHFVAEGEVGFKSLLYIPKVQPSDSFNRYGTKSDNIKLYVRRVFITDKITDMMPNYLSFIRGLVDSDDLPLNVSRENLQQHKLIKVIKKKLVRKVLDMMMKISEEDYPEFWKEYSTNIKLGLIEDSQNRARLSKLLRFRSSTKEMMTSLSDYVSRMKPKQTSIFYIAGSSVDEVKKSPFVEKLTKKDYEVLFLTEPVDEYSLSSLSEFEGKRFQNVAKDGFSLDEGEKAKERLERLKTQFEPLTKWLDDTLKNYISKTQISERLAESPCALVASMFGWTGNMERLALSNAHQKSEDPQKTYYMNQKKTLEINPKHPLVRELLRRVESDSSDENAKEMAHVMFEVATLRSGYMLKETSTFAESIEKLMKKYLGIPLDERVEEDNDLDEDEESGSNEDDKVADINADEAEDEKHEEL